MHLSNRRRRKGRIKQRRYISLFSSTVVAVATLLVSTSAQVIFAMKSYEIEKQYTTHEHIQHPISNNRRRRGRRKCDIKSDAFKLDQPIDFLNTINQCRGGSSTEVQPSTTSTTQQNQQSDGPIQQLNPSVATDDKIGLDISNIVRKVRTRSKRSKLIPPQVNDNEEYQTVEQQRQSISSYRPKIVIDFDTQAVGSSIYQQQQGIRHRIRSRIGNDDDKIQSSINQGPALTISFSPPSSSTHYTSDISNTITTTNSINSHQSATMLENLFIPTQVIIQTIALLPPLLLSRRVLNSTWIAIVDYVRGRTFRQTFTSLERAYLRYYEFPAVIRSTARLVSQIGILLGLNWLIRWWMILVMSTSDVGPAVLGVTGIDIGLVGTASKPDWNEEDPFALFGPGWNVGLPCQQRGKGMAWLCGFIWIGLVVGIGHMSAMALSVWGGPLRLHKASVQHAENPKHVLRRVILHPINWFKELDEWKHLSALKNKRRADRNHQSEVGDRTFNPDPLLFPATWLPLRWLQIFAITKAFSTDPLQYRWCSPDNDKVVIPRLMKQYLVQLALGDEWQRVFLGERRVGLGILVVLSYFVSLIWMVCTTFTLDGGAAAMLIPSVLAAIISGLFNIMIFWNRLGTKEQKKALNAFGLA